MKVFVVFFITLTFFSKGYELSLNEAIRLAVKHSNKVSNLNIKKAKYEYYASLSDMGMKVNLQGNYQYWDKPLKMKFLSSEDLQNVPEAFKNMLPSGDSVIREQSTYSFSVSVVQPLTPLYIMYLTKNLKGINLEVSELDKIVKQKEVRLQVIENFFRLIQMKKVKEALLLVKKGLLEHKKDALSFYKVKLITKDTLLAIDVKLKEIEIKLLEIDSTINILKANLNILMGKDIEDEFTPKFRVDGAIKLPEIGIEDAILQAKLKRPEVKKVELAIKMAKIAKKMSFFNFMPNINALFNYQYTSGNKFADKESYFFGISLNFNVWEWGKSYFGIKENDTQILIAEESLKNLQDYIALEVKNLYNRMIASYHSIETAKLSIVQAKENLKIKKEKFKQNITTSSEVLDAEASLINSESKYYEAVFNFLIAKEKFYEAIGEQ